MSLTCLNFMVIIKPKVLFQFRTLHYLRPDTCRSYIKILTMNTNILLHDFYFRVILGSQSNPN